MLALRGVDEDLRRFQTVFVYAYLVLAVPLSLFAVITTFLPAYFILRHINLTAAHYYAVWGAIVFALTGFLTASLKPTGATTTAAQMQWFVIAPAVLGAVAGLLFWVAAVRGRTEAST